LNKLKTKNYSESLFSRYMVRECKSSVKNPVKNGSSLLGENGYVQGVRKLVRGGQWDKKAYN